MSHDEQQQPPPEPKTLGMIAQFPDAHDLVSAARKTTDEGYRRVDAHSPFPIHGIDDALRAPKTILPWMVFTGGLIGCLTAIAIQFYMNGIEVPGFYYSGYPFGISAKPTFSLPANVPIIFELIILFSSLTAFFGMIALNGLPKLHNPLFYSERFSRVTNDGFFLWVDARDGKFDPAATADWLNSIGATHVETIEEVVRDKEVPAMLLAVGAIGAAIALVPPLWVAAAAGKSTEPRLSLWWDMDYQVKLKPQQSTDLFADGRAMRVAIPGTVARGHLPADQQYQTGVQQDGVAAAGGPPAMLASYQQEDAAEGEAGGEAAEGEPQTPPEPNWVTEFPLEVDTELMERGQRQFNIYCATCHGQAGYGDGLITQRAMSLNQGTWVQPLSLHDAAVRDQPVGRIYNTVTHGIRKMPGYSRQISTEDRWAVVLYVKALQRSQHASLDDIPEDQRPKR